MRANRPRILFLNNQGLGAIGGGVSIMRHLAEAFAPDMDVTVMSYDLPHQAPAGIRQVQMPAPPEPGTAFWRFAPVIRARHMVRTVSRAALESADMVVVLDCHAALALNGVAPSKIVYLSLSCIARQERAGGRGRLTCAQYAWLERRAALAAGRVVVASQVHADELARWEGLRNLRPIVLHPCLPSSGLPSSTEVPARPPAGRVPTILCAARMQPEKSFALALELAVRLRGIPYRLVFAGDGPMRGALEEQAASAGIADQVSFAGPTHNLPALLAQADILLHTSSYESFGMVIFEAMRAGLVPVGRRDPGLVLGYQEIVRDGVDCRLLDLTDIDAAAAQLRGLLIDADERARLGETARASARRILSGPSYADRFRDLLGVPAAVKEAQRA
jgi:glycosyltransferase involved in cell wall biosynthesis